LKTALRRAGSEFQAGSRYDKSKGRQQVAAGSDLTQKVRYDRAKILWFNRAGTPHGHTTRTHISTPRGEVRIDELRCRSFVPASISASNDMRRPGICVNRLQLDGLDVPLYDDDTFAVGWHALEHDASGQWRWSHASAQLPASARLVVIDLVNVGCLYWLQPPDAALVSGSSRPITA
jgi:hypothetical protein